MLENRNAGCHVQNVLLMEESMAEIGYKATATAQESRWNLSKRSTENWEEGRSLRTIFKSE